MSLSKKGYKLVGKAVLAVYSLFALFPIYWMVNTSLKPLDKINTIPPTFLPEELTFAAFVWVFTSEQGQNAIIDSLIVTVGATVLSVVLGTLAAYAFSRDPERVGGKDVAFWLLSTRMFPPIAIVLPVFFIWGWIGLRDTRLGLMILYLTFNLPLTTWLMRDYFNQIPRSYEEAAYINGYSKLEAFVKIVLPQARSGLVATTLLAWIFAWNEFLFAFVLSELNIATYPTVIPKLQVSYNVEWNRMMAFALIVTLPPTLILFKYREHILNGMSFGVADID